MENLNADSPITDRKADALDYWPFAQSLAKGLVGRTPRDGFVIGIQARWGMGKTSAINLLLQAIRESEKERAAQQKTKIQKFNPWLFAGLETLVKGYLSELGWAIRDTVGDATPRKTSQFIDRLVRGGAEFMGGAAALGAIVASHGTAAPIAGAVKSALTGALSLGSNMIDTRSIEAMIEDLSAHLSSLECRFLIIVDDLDRLQPDELRQILTLVKTFGNLPNITHLLAYDREIVNAALSGLASNGLEDDLPTFLEKVVQVELDLPYPTENGLRKLTTEKLAAIFGPSPEMDLEDWLRVSEVAFQHYLKSPRDVVRVCNALSIVWPSVEAEVYMPDLLAVELLRHYERATYDLIRSLKHYLTGRGIVGDKAREQAGRRLIETISPNRRDDVANLLAAMFPGVSRYLAERNAYYHGTQDLLRGRRIGRPDGFDSYFRFTMPPDQISVSDLRKISAHLDDEEYLTKFIERALETHTTDGTSFIAPLLGSLPTILDGLQRLDPALFKIFLQIGDRIIEQKDEDRSFPLMTNRNRLGSVLRTICRHLDNEAIQSTLVAALDDQKTGIGTAAMIVAELAADRGLGPIRKFNAEDISSLTHEQVEELGKRISDRISDMARSDTLPISSMTDYILVVWASFADPNGPRCWVNIKIHDPREFRNLIFGAIMHEISSSSAPYRYRTLRNDINEAVFDLAEMLHRAKLYLEAHELAEDDEPDIVKFVTEVEQRLKDSTQESAAELEVAAASDSRVSE
jgi:predicted KAP-like P-loop ATPase